jgi:hypothetical protein
MEPFVNILDGLVQLMLEQVLDYSLMVVNTFVAA